MGDLETLPSETVTQVIDEVYIRDDSNTRRVCLELIERSKHWGDIHRGGVICYGDETGGSRKSSSERSDWQPIEDYIGRQRGNFWLDLPSMNPSERDRLVVTNSRLKSSMGAARVFVDMEQGARGCTRAWTRPSSTTTGTWTRGPRRSGRTLPTGWVTCCSSDSDRR